MKSARRLRIAVSGYAGIGKTQLCVALADRLRLPVIPEGMAAISRAGEQFSAALRTFHADPQCDERDSARRALIDEFRAWTMHRNELCANPAGYVADRWEADLLAWWLISNLVGDDSATVALTEAMQARARQLDYVVFPYVTKPFAGAGSINTDGLVRAGSFSQHIAFHTMLAGLMHELTQVRVIRLPHGVETAEARAEHVLNVIANDRAPKGEHRRTQ